MEQARAEVQALANRMAVADADSNQGIGATVLPVWQSHFGTQSILLTPITILMGASRLVLLIVCANLANLLLARATGRLKEFSVRLAMGARPMRLIQQLLTETLQWAVAGSVCGLELANLLGDALRWLLPAVAMPAMLQPPLDGQVLAFTMALAFGVAILAGLAPALHASRANVNETLKEGGRSGSSGGHSHRIAWAAGDLRGGTGGWWRASGCGIGFLRVFRPHGPWIRASSRKVWHWRASISPRPVMMRGRPTVSAGVCGRSLSGSPE